MGNGINVCNVPLGSQGYVTSFLTSKAEVVASNIRRISKELANYANEAWCLLFYSSAAQWQYWIAHAYPCDTRGPSTIVDEALIQAATAATGVDFAGSEISRKRLRLPARLRGAGLRSLVETTNAAFIGSVNQALPRFLDHVDSAGERVAGFFPSLSSWFGAGSFDAHREDQRYARYLLSGLAGARELETAWNAMRTEAGNARISDADCVLKHEAEGARGSQRELTFTVEGRRYEQLEIDISALPLTEEASTYLRVAWSSCDKNSAIWVTGIPTQHYRAGTAEFREICATYFGMPSPIASAHAGQGIFGKNGRPRGTCDQFGLKLSSLQLDNRWNDGHDEVKFAIARGLEILGVGVEAEAHNIFTSCVPPHARAAAGRFMRGQRPDGGRGVRQGLIPDLKINLSKLVDGAASTEALGEVKMVHCGRTGNNPVGGSTYPTRGGGNVLLGRCRAVQQRAARIQLERNADARKIDEKFCGTAQGAEGPVLQRLRSFGPIVDLVVGHFGEWSKGIERLLAAAVDDAAPRMSALLDARTIRDSKGRCAWLFRREVAWAALNVNAKLRLERAGFVGWDAHTANSRRAERERRDESRRATCAWASAAFDRAREGPFAQGRFPFPRAR